MHIYQNFARPCKMVSIDFVSDSQQMKLYDYVEKAESSDIRGCYISFNIYNIFPVSPDPCSNSPCQNGGNCSAVSSGFVCTCPPGYTGSLCETDVDECASAPCLFGGQCIDKVDSFECVCPSMLGGVRFFS